MGQWEEEVVAEQDVMNEARKDGGYTIKLSMIVMTDMRA